MAIMDENETAGALAQIAPQSVAAAPMAASAQAASQQASAPQPSEYEKAIADLQKQRLELVNRHKQLIDSLEARVVGPQEMMFALSSGFLAPTRSGGFGEALGRATQNLGQHFAQQKQQMSDIAKMKLELQMQELGMREKDVERIKSTSIQSAIQDAFKPMVDESGKTTYQFDPSSVQKIIQSGGSFDDVLKVAKAIPDLRRSGMLGGASVEGTPFDAIALMAPSPELRSHAERLQKQYKAGAFKDEESAEKASQQLLQLITSSMDKEKERAFRQTVETIMLGIRQNQMQMNMEKFEEERRSREGKLTDQQKIDYNKVIVPVINEGAKANSALLELYGIENKIKNAPSGVLSGAYASSVGRLRGTDENTALREIDRLQKSLLTQIPRLPGAQSNFDSQNLEKSIGQLSDLSLTNKQRADLVSEIKKGFKRLADRAYETQVYWDTNKSIPPSLFGKETTTEKTIVRSGTVTEGPNKGKKVIEYSDGSLEYK